MSLTVTDMFCGASRLNLRCDAVPGAQLDLATNHWQPAIETHNTTTRPLTMTVRISRRWAGTVPACGHPVGVTRVHEPFAGKGIKLGIRPVGRQAAARWLRSVCDVARFAEYDHYQAIIIENIVPAYRRVVFPAWLMAMEALNYEHQIVWLNSMHAQAYGLPAPQSRDRMYVIFWRKGNRKPDLQKWTRPHAYCADHTGR